MAKQLYSQQKAKKVGMKAKGQLTVKIGRKTKVRGRAELIHRVYDFDGKEIKVGYDICYPVRRGAQMDMKKLNVTKIEPEAIHGVSPEGRLKTITQFRYVAVYRI